MVEKYCLVISLGHHHLAVPASNVLQVLQQPKVFPLPQCREEMGGVLFFQEEIIPLLRLEKIFPSADDFRQDICYVMVCTSGQGLVGLPCERIVKIVDPSVGKLIDQESEAFPGHRQDFVYFDQHYSYLEIEQLLPQCP